MGYHVSQEKMEEIIACELARRAQGGQICSMLKLEYVSSDADNGELVMRHEVLPEASNPAGKLHGGITAWLLDSTMGILSRSYTGYTRTVTLDIHVSYLRGIDIGSELLIKARITHAGKTTINICSEASVNGKLYATADAIFFRVE